MSRYPIASATLRWYTFTNLPRSSSDGSSGMCAHPGMGLWSAGTEGPAPGEYRRGDEVSNHLDHVVEHGVAQPGEDTNPERPVRHEVGVGERADLPARLIHVRRLADEVPSEQQSSSNATGLEVLDQVKAVEASIRVD